MLVDLRKLNELHQHLRIRIGLEGIALLHEAGFEHRVVLDDTVMDDRQPLGLRVMRMGVDRIGFAVRRPARMGDTDGTAYILGRAERFQFRHFAFGLIDIELSGFVDERYAGAVIAAILETMKSLDENRIRLAATDISYNSTHML